MAKALCIPLPTQIFMLQMAVRLGVTDLMLWLHTQAHRDLPLVCSLLISFTRTPSQSHLKKVTGMTSVRICFGVWPLTKLQFRQVSRSLAQSSPYLLVGLSTSRHCSGFLGLLCSKVLGSVHCWVGTAASP